MFVSLEAWLGISIQISLRTYSSYPKLMFTNNWTDPWIPCERLLVSFLFQKIRNMGRIVMTRRWGILAKKINFVNSLIDRLIYFIFILSKYTLLCFKWISKILFFLTKFQLIGTELIDWKLWTLLLLISQSWMISWFILFINTTLRRRWI